MILLLLGFLVERISFSILFLISSLVDLKIQSNIIHGIRLTFLCISIINLTLTYRSYTDYRKNTYEEVQRLSKSINDKFSTPKIEVNFLRRNRLRNRYPIFMEV